MNNEEAEQPWEILPWSTKPGETDFAIWISRGDGRKPYIALSNQCDVNEEIILGSVEDIDELIAKLQEARVWMEGTII